MKRRQGKAEVKVRPGSGRALALAIALALAGVSWTSEAQAQEEPIVVGQRRKVEPLRLNPPRVAVDLSAAYRHDKTTSGDSTQNFQETFFTQSVGLETEGYVFTPSFIELNLQGDFGLTESFLDTDDDSSNNTGQVYRWDVAGTYRKDSDTPLRLFSQREQQWLSREFGSTLESTVTSTGAQLGIQHRNASTRLLATHADSEQTGLDGEDDFTSARDFFVWSTVFRPDLRNTLNWNYSFSDVDQSGTLNTEYQTHTASLTHELLMGKDRQHSLYSGVTYDLRTGDQDLQTLRLDERLRLRHTRQFETRYDYRLDYTDFSGNERLRNFGRAGFLHQLYQSLTTTGNVFASHTAEVNNDVTTTELGGDLNFNYRKKVPYGIFFSNLGMSMNRQETSERGSDTTIIDQPGTFADPLPIVITGTNIDPGDIVITDPSGLTVFTPGIDYTVTKFADRVEISRIIGGAIPNLAPVLIDYDLLPLPGSESTTRYFSISGRYELTQTFLSGLAVYATYSRQSQDIETNNPSAFNDNDFNDYLYGIDYTVGAFRLGAERQEHVSDLNGLDATRYYARYVQRFNDWTASANAAYTTIDFTTTGNETELITLSAQMRYQVSRRLSATGTISWREQSDSVSGDTNGFEQQLELQWTHRQTTIYGRARNATLETEDDKNSYQLFQIGLRREF